MIKKYHLFLEDVYPFDTEYKLFIDTLVECENYYTYEVNGFRQFSISYSYTAQANKGDLDPEEDYQRVLDYFHQHGWSNDRIHRLTEGNRGKFFRKIYDKNPCASAPIDYFLYKLTHKEYPLQGAEWTLDDYDDLVVKFRYGWMKTRYGKLAIDQNLGGIKEFYAACFSGIPKLLNDDIESNVQHKVCQPNNWAVRRDFENALRGDVLKTFIFDDKENLEIYIDTESMFLELKKILSEIELDLTFDQSEFDELVYNVCINTGLKCRIVVPGDIKTSF